MTVEAEYLASYFFVIFYFWLLVTLSVIEIGYVVNGSKELFNSYKRMNILFISILFISIINVLFYYIF